MSPKVEAEEPYVDGGFDPPAKAETESKLESLVDLLARLPAAVFVD